MSVQNSYNRVQRELKEVGLWETKGNYLAEVELCQTWLPSLNGELGYIFEDGISPSSKLLGYKQGTIYIPSMAPISSFATGESLVDVIRHEFGHGWVYIDPLFFDNRWYVKAFGRSYWSEWKNGEKIYDFYKAKNNIFEDSDHFNHYVSPYAISSPKEDFAETFMYFLKYRKTLERFATRSGVYKKLIAIDKATHSVRRSKRASNRSF